MQQLEKNKNRIAAILANMKTAEPEQKRQLRDRLKYWQSQVRMMEAAQESKNQFKPLWNI